MPIRSVLLVHPDADRWLEEAPNSSIEVTTASSAMEGRAYLAGTAFDTVWIGPDADASGRIEALRDALGLEVEIEHVEVADVERRLRDDTGNESAEEESERSSVVRKSLVEVRDELSRVAHDLNNPLAVIAGNAQLAAEMARAVPTDETVVEAIASIQQAAGELEALFADVAALRRLVDRAIG